MKVDGRNYLVIATFLGIKGEAGRIPPLEIWAMYKEEVRYRQIQIVSWIKMVLLRIANIGINLAGNCC